MILGPLLLGGGESGFPGFFQTFWGHTESAIRAGSAGQKKQVSVETAQQIWKYSFGDYLCTALVFFFLKNYLIFCILTMYLGSFERINHPLTTVQNDLNTLEILHPNRHFLTHC